VHFGKSYKKKTGWKRQDEVDDQCYYPIRGHVHKLQQKHI